MDKLEILTKLAPYLPHNIQVQYEFEKWERDWRLWEDTMSVSRLEFLISDKCRNPKPHLYSFSQLTTPILHKGKEVIPAVEVAKLALNIKHVHCIECSDLSVEVEVITASGTISIYEEYDVAIYSNDEYKCAHNQVAIVDFLREMHFAVGFEEGEYIEKEVQP